MITDHGKDCPRCTADHFTWLDCTCFVRCRRVTNCNGLKPREGT